jgi:hypothetical protein
VIAVESDQTPPRGPRFCFEAIEQLQDCSIVVTSVDLIAGLNDGEIAPRPVIGLVDGARQDQDLTGRSEISMHIANRNEPPALGQSRRETQRRLGCFGLGFLS